jgi:hypothetical protein
MEQRDYAESGLTVREAMLDADERRSWPPGVPPKIRWGEHIICTADVIHVAPHGRLRLEFLERASAPRQAVDIDMKGGCVLADGRLIPRLRTMADPGLERVVEYEYHAADSKIRVWNSYEMRRGASLVFEMWTENAAMWVEEIGPNEREYHCSPGPVRSPDFNALRFRLSWRSID